jgi:hypothetical protein
MSRMGKSFSLLILSCGLLAAETRFGLPVANLEFPKSFHFLELTANKFAVSQRSDIVVATTVYGGPWRYFVDVAINNKSTQTIQLADDFVRFHKNGTAIAATDTHMIASEIQRVMEQAQTVAARQNGPANFGAAALQQRAVAEKDQKDTQNLVTHLTAFAHEKESLTLAPGKMTMYTFVFSAPDREKMPFELCIEAADTEFVYQFK